jgi:uncharacterized membrane protein YfcA
MMAYMVTGAVGTWIYARAGAISWSMIGWLCAGAIPAAVLGAWAANAMRPGLVLLVIGLLTTAAGVHALLEGRLDEGHARVLAPTQLCLIGAITGVLSALTGTGGPLVLVPILLWLRIPILSAIGLSQAIQLPIASFATIGNAYFGAIDLRLGALLAVALAVGAWIGGRVAHLTPRETLRRVVAVVLAVLGALIAIDAGRTALRWTQ